MKRTSYCGELTAKEIGNKHILCGWVHSWRNHGGVLFIDLRDRTGLMQVVVGPDKPEVFKIAYGLRSEYVIQVTGTVRARLEGYANKNMATGEVELPADEIKILNTAKQLPFEVGENFTASEETRLKYRYIDLRRPKMFNNLRTRHIIAQATRRYFDRNGFLEVETPILARSTPEGARDYLVPSRLTPGHFYALPQSPQTFKQVLMASGIDRYFQLARAFRDEDLRADRQPEHTQIDFEMSFVEEADVFKMVEGLMTEVFAAVGEKIETPFMQMDYHIAMSRYGSDKPDLRFGMEINDCTPLFKNTGFKVFSEIIAAGGVIRALKAEGGAKFSRGDMDKLTAFAKTKGAKGLVWLKAKGDTLESPSAKFFTPEEIAGLRKQLDVKEGDAIFLGSDKEIPVSLFMGELRKELIKKLELKPLKKWALLWVTHFPLLEWHEDEGRYDAAHNPFTAPMEDDIPKLDTDPGNVRSHQYDMVLNGTELASGSIRNHKRELQEKVLGLMKYTKEQSAQRFGMLLNALEAGAPPHGGAAIGLDRLTAIICGEDSIREVIAFPKTASASCPLSEAPNTVDEKQLKELHLKIVE